MSVEETCVRLQSTQSGLGRSEGAFVQHCVNLLVRLPAVLLLFMTVLKGEGAAVLSAAADGTHNCNQSRSVVVGGGQESIAAGEGGPLFEEGGGGGGKDLEKGRGGHKAVERSPRARL